MQIIKGDPSHPDKVADRIAGAIVDLAYKFITIPFERVRRITGYLVGDMSKWNDAKYEEEKDRVKHTNRLEQL